VQKIEAVKDLGSHTEETLAALKLVISFNREDLACKEFDKIVHVTRNKALTAAKTMSLLTSFFFTVAFAFFCYTYYIGSVFVEKNFVEPGKEKKLSIKTIVAAS